MTTIRNAALASATVLAALWAGAAIAAPLAVYPANSAALFDAAMRGEVPVQEIESQTESQIETGAALAPELQRQIVNYRTDAVPGTVIIDTANTHLYFVLGNGQAIRYGIGVGRDGFTWSGAQVVTRKAEWPDWTPPEEMIVRQPYLARWMAGGEGNPLGARAIYLGSTVYRIHGTNMPETIGQKVSSGCIRMLNADVMDLYSRVSVGTRIFVLANREQVVAAAPVAHARYAPQTQRVSGLY